MDKICKISFWKKLFFQSTFKATISNFFKILGSHFQNSFVSIFCYVFCAKLKDKTLKSYWKPNNSVKSVEKISFDQKLFFSKFMRGQIRHFFQISETSFSKQFCPNLFFVFSVLISRLKHKKAIENRKQVYFFLHYELYKFLSIFGIFAPLRPIF